MVIAGFYFAWANSDDDFDVTLHVVEDEDIVEFNFEHLEGEFGVTTITIKNPRVGLLKAGRKRWAFLSWFNGTTIEPLFKGRLAAVPSGINRELITIEFVARPENYALQKELLADQLRVLPYFDPAFVAVDKLTDPDLPLEGYTAAWCIDRLTHDVTVSDILSDIETPIEFGPADVPYDSVEITLEQPPIKKVHVTASVKWTQEVAGTGLILLKNYKVETLAGGGLIGRWPDLEANLEGGYIVTDRRADSLYATVTDQDFAFWAATPNKILETPLPFSLSLVSAYSANGSSNNGVLETDTSQTTYNIINDRVFLDLSLGYAASRKRTDIVEFTLVANSQAILTDPNDNDQIDIDISGNDVGLPIASEYDAIPIGDVQRRSYFTQPRGQLSLQYLLQIARAMIIVRARAVRVKFKCSFERAVELSLRHSVRLIDPRLPGGSAVGKVVGYSFRAGGGEISGTCTIACCIGYGGAWVAQAGTPTYVEEGVMERDCQVYEGETLILGASDVFFEPLVQEPNDDGLVFPLSELPVVVAPHIVTVEGVELVAVPPFIVTSMTPDSCGDITNTSITSNLDTGPYNEWLGKIKTTVDFSLKPLKGTFETRYLLGVSELKLPQQINLEAA